MHLTQTQTPLSTLLLSVVGALLLFVTGTFFVTSTAVAEEAASFPKAPAWNVNSWIQGGPVDVTTGDKIYVVDMWATWCGSCVEGFPHLTEIQKKYGEKVEVIALSDEGPRKVRNFIKRQRGIGFSVATDKTTAVKWMNTFRINKIPTSLIVRGGEVIWVGPPKGIEMVLDAALAGKWTAEASQRLLEAQRVSFLYVTALMETATPMTTEMTELGEQVLKDGRLSPPFLNAVAWSLLKDVPKERRPLKLALRMAAAANEDTKNESPDILDTYALALFANADIPGAVAHERKALTRCKLKTHADCEHFSRMLVHYQALEKSPH